jgi:hypothetical protein
MSSCSAGDARDLPGAFGHDRPAGLPDSRRSRQAGKGSKAALNAIRQQAGQELPLAPYLLICSKAAARAVRCEADTPMECGPAADCRHHGGQLRRRSRALNAGSLRNGSSSNEVRMYCNLGSRKRSAMPSHRRASVKRPH